MLNYNVDITENKMVIFYRSRSWCYKDLNVISTVKIMSSVHLFFRYNNEGFLELISSTEHYITKHIYHPLIVNILNQTHPADSLLTGKNSGIYKTEPYTSLNIEMFYTKIHLFASDKTKQ